MQTVDERTGASAFRTMVPMRDGTRLNTFVFLPKDGGPQFPVILHRTPYGIAAADAPDKFDCTKAWLPNPAEPMRGSILRGWKRIIAESYAAVYQDCRGRASSHPLCPAGRRATCRAAVHRFGGLVASAIGRLS